MARISTRNLIDGGERTTPRTSTPAKSSFVDPQDVRDPVTGLTPAQVAAQKALTEAVTAGAALGIKTTPNVATPGNVPTVTVTKVPTVVTMPTLAPSPTLSTGPTGGGRRVVSTYTDEVTGDVIAVYNDGSSAVISKGNRQAMAALAAQQQAAAEAARKKEAGLSAYTLLFEQFNQYGLGSLVEPLKNLIVEGLSPAEFTLRLRDTDAYKKRFAANATRINKGLRALSEAEYVGLEDQYQNVMRRYGLPENYYTRGDMGRQEGFEKFIGGDVSPVELEDRIQLAQNRVINAAPEVASSLRSFYPDITNGDILAYALDPDKALEGIRRKVTAAEIGGAAAMAGLATGVSRAEELARFGVTGETARQGVQNIAEILPRGSQLAEIYKQSPYTQATAEQEVFGITGAAEAAQKRRRLQQLETATFSGSSGAAGGALGRERAGAF
jgi:hypothetical protein